jgi:diguanylate cyclase (GGDEF)-like protein
MLERDFGRLRLDKGGHGREHGKSRNTGVSVASKSEKRLRFAVLVDVAISRFQEKPRLGINRYAREAGVDAIYLAVGRMNPTSPEDRANLRFFDMISPDEFDGVLVVSTSLVNYGGTDILRDKLEGLRGIPMVSIGPSIIGESGITFDNRRGTRDVMRHLIEDHGYRRIAYVSGPMGNEEARERLEAYRSSIGAAGLELGEDWIYTGNFLYPSGIAAVDAFLDERRLAPEAIVCANDMMALGAWDAMGKRGKMVPFDVAVAGYDDFQLSRAMSHRFTTVRQSFDTLGYLAMERLHAMALGHYPPESSPLPAELLIRSSCGCVQIENRRGIAAKWDDALRVMSGRIASFLEGAGAWNDERDLYRAWSDTVVRALDEKLPVHELEAVLREAANRVASREEPRTVAAIVANLYSILMEECGQITFFDRWSEIVETGGLAAAVDRLQDEIAGDLSLTTHDAEFMRVVELCGARSFYALRFLDPALPSGGATPVFAYDADGAEGEWKAEPGHWFPRRGRSLVANMIGIGGTTWGYVLVDAEIPSSSIFDYLRFRFSNISKDFIALSRIRNLNAEMAQEIAARKETERKLKDALGLVEKMSVEDELTRLRNRRGFIAMAEQQLKYLRRLDQGFFLIYGDLDGLKAINDKWGHADGDIAIRSIADVLRESLRESDIIARLGGDEFTALVSNANPPSYESIERRILDACARKDAELGKPWSLSISLGHFHSPPGCDYTLERMLELSDEDLYAVKQRKKTGGLPSA